MIDVLEYKECLGKVEEAISKILGREIKIIVFDMTENGKTVIEYVDKSSQV